MNKPRQQRLLAIVLLFTGLSVAIALISYALRQNINLFYTPSQVVDGQAPKQHTFRIGGLVTKGSVKHLDNNVSIQFTVTDTVKQVVIQYTGILPDLFREGQGIVAQGQLDQNGRFIATQVLAKHDEKYMPPEVQDALNKTKKTT